VWRAPWGSPSSCIRTSSEHDGRPVDEGVVPSHRR
jgi:hypothetical protein